MLTLVAETEVTFRPLGLVGGVVSVAAEAPATASASADASTRPSSAAPRRIEDFLAALAWGRRDSRFLISTAFLVWFWRPDKDRDSCPGRICPVRGPVANARGYPGLRQIPQQRDTPRPRRMRV